MTSLLQVLGLILLIGLVFVLPALGMRDASRHPDWVWARAGENKSSWLILMACSFAFFVPPASLVGVGATGMYWASRRKKLLAAASGGAPSAWMPLAGTPSTAMASAGTLPQVPAAGWYADPSGQSRLRWWDGSSWTPHVSS